MSKQIVVGNKTFILPDETPCPDVEHTTWTGNTPWQIALRKALGIKEVTE